MVYSDCGGAQINAQPRAKSNNLIKERNKAHEKTDSRYP